jgi:hypothetical protein
LMTEALLLRRGRRISHPPPCQRGGDRPKGGGGGAGLDENSFNESDASSQTPPPPCFAWSPSPAVAGAEIKSRPRDAHASEFCKQTARKLSPPIKEGRRSADRRNPSMSAPHIRALPHEHASGADARHKQSPYGDCLLRARSPLGAPTAALATQINAMAQPRPRFARNTMRRRYLR